MSALTDPARRAPPGAATLADCVTASMPSPPPMTDPRPRMSLRKQVQAVLWSFIGLGRRKDMAELDQGASPVVLVVVALILLVVFVAVLMQVARWAAG